MVVCVPRLTDTRWPRLQPCSPHQSSNCLEAAVVLGTLLSRLRTPSHLPSLLYAYHDLRAPRAARLHALELKNRRYMSLSGSFRIARDQALHARASVAEAGTVESGGDAGKAPRATEGSRRGISRMCWRGGDTMPAMRRRSGGSGEVC